MARPKKTDTPDAAAEILDAATEPKNARISVIDRRLKNPFGAPSFDVPLKGEKKHWVVRCFVADKEHPNRHYDAVHRLGYLPLAPEDLSCSPESLGFSVSPDRRIVRGPHSEEVLMAIEREHFDAVQQAKAAANLRALSKGQLREAVAHETAKVHGDEAGEFTHKHFSREETAPETV